MSERPLPTERPAFTRHIENERRRVAGIRQAARTFEDLAGGFDDAVGRLTDDAALLRRLIMLGAQAQRLLYDSHHDLDVRVWFSRLPKCPDPPQTEEGWFSYWVPAIDLLSHRSKDGARFARAFVEGEVSQTEQGITIASAEPPFETHQRMAWASATACRELARQYGTRADAIETKVQEIEAAFEAAQAQAMTQAAAPAVAEREDPSCDPGGEWLYWHGGEYRFRDTARDIVRLLWKAWKGRGTAKRRGLTRSELARDLNKDVVRVSEYFRDRKAGGYHQAWGRVIRWTGGRGMRYWYLGDE